MASHSDESIDVPRFEFGQLPEQERKHVAALVGLTKDLETKFDQDSNEILERTKEVHADLTALVGMLLSIHWSMLQTPTTWNAPQTEAEGWRRFLAARSFTTAFVSRRLMLGGLYQDAMTLVRTLLDCHTYQRAWRRDPVKAKNLWDSAGRSQHSQSKARHIAGLATLAPDYDLLSAASHAHAEALLGLVGKTKHGTGAILIGPFFNEAESRYCLEMQAVGHRGLLVEFSLDHPELDAVLGGRVRGLLAAITRRLIDHGVIELGEELDTDTPPSEPRSDG